MELTHHYYPKVTWQHAMRRSLTLSLIFPSFTTGVQDSPTA